MTRVIARGADGSVTLPADVVAAADLGDQLVVEVEEGMIFLRAKDGPTDARLGSGGAPDAELPDPAAEFLDWVASLPAGPGLSDEATSRESIYR